MHINEFRKAMLAKRAAAANAVQVATSQAADETFLLSTSIDSEDFIMRRHMFEEIRRNMDNLKKQPKS